MYPSFLIHKKAFFQSFGKKAKGENNRKAKKRGEGFSYCLDPSNPNHPSPSSMIKVSMYPCPWIILSALGEINF